MLEDFWEDYESSADSVNSANYALISNALQRWLYMLDSNALVVQHLEPLEKSMDFDKWYAECEATQGGMSGTARLTLPIETERRLGAMLFLMRKSAADQLGAVDIGHSFLGGDAHYDTNVREFQSQIFQPLRYELKTYLSRLLRDKPKNDGQGSSEYAPAADRIVPLNHNSDPYHDAIESLNRIRDAVAQSNNYFDEDDRAQRVAELSAGHELLEAPQARIDAVRTVLLPTLKYLAKKFGESIIGKLAEAALHALLALLGIDFLG